MTDLTPDEARALIRGGARYGDVCGRLPEGERPALAAWCVAEPGVPAAAAVRERVGALLRCDSRTLHGPVRPAGRAAPEQSPVPTGDGCPRCGGLMVRTGMCMTCQSCGESSGGCG